MMVVDALSSAMAPAGSALHWMAGAVDGATLDGGGRHRLGCHRPGYCV